MVRLPKARAKAPAIAAPQSREEAAASLRRIGDIGRDIGRLEADLNDQVAALRAQYEQAASVLAAERAAELRGLQIWAEANRLAETDGGKVKFIALGTGLVRWRLRPPSVSLKKGLTMDVVLNSLRFLGRGEFLRIKAALDKEAIHAALAAPVEDPKQREQLMGDLIACGLRFGSEGEDFVAEPAELELTDGRAA